VVITFRQEAGRFQLGVADDGVGMPPADETGPPPQPPPTGGIGQTLVRALSAQLNGTVSVRPSPGTGTSIRVEFPD
jgi:signal transduction histidine kinase